MRVRFFLYDEFGETVKSFVQDVNDGMTWQDLDEIGFAAVEDSPVAINFDYEAEEEIVD